MVGSEVVGIDMRDGVCSTVWWHRRRAVSCRAVSCRVMYGPLLSLDRLRQHSLCLWIWPRGSVCFVHPFSVLGVRHPNHSVFPAQLPMMCLCYGQLLRVSRFGRHSAQLLANVCAGATPVVWKPCRIVGTATSSCGCGCQPGRVRLLNSMPP
jgi:hypothetical protein